MTGDAYRLGGAIESPEQLDALKAALAENQTAMQAAKKAGDFNAAIALASKGQYFREAYEYATGTGSAAHAMRDNPNYKPKFDETGKLREAAKPAEPAQKLSPVAEPVAPIVDQPVKNPKADAAEAKANEAKQQQQLIPAGPGAATRPDLVPGGPDLPVESGNPDVYGIAERVREERAKAGQVAPVQPGVGVSAPDSVQHGRVLLKGGANPEAALANFEKTGRLSADDMALVRAEGERLAKDARAIEEKFGTKSKEYQEAWTKLSAWDNRTKAMQTEWHKTGQAQQGETDLDTGSFTGLQRAYREATGKEFTNTQAIKAREIVKKVKVAANAAVDATKNLYNQLDLVLQGVDVPVPKNLDEARAQFAGFKKGNEFTPQQVKTLWNAARTYYLDRGVVDYNDVRNGLATDFGLHVDDVTRALAQTKGVKRLSDEAFVKQTNARRAVEQARRWLKQTQLPAYQRALSSIPQILFGLKVGFHGTVALGTHAPMVAFQPPFWASYFRDFGKMYKMVGSPAYYERQVQDLLRRPNFITARRAGLVNDPFTYEDYNSPDVAKYIGRMSGMGNRGYFVLKVLRQDMFDQMWNGVPESTKSPEVAKALADGLNHATGVVRGMAPKGANIALFAPRLMASRAAWLVADPVKMVDTFARWKGASEADKTFAINQMKEKAWVLGTMAAMLAINQGILSATDSKQKVNFTDPMKSDFLKFKVGGMNFSYGNAMLTMARLPARLYAIRQSNGGKLKNVVYPDEDVYSALGEYTRSQLSPFASLAADLWFKSDWMRRQLPGSNRPMPARLRRQGVKPYTWPEFWAEQLLPIPAEEALREVWKNGMGMHPDQVKSMRKALATIAIMAATGARLSDDTETKK